MKISKPPHRYSRVTEELPILTCWLDESLYDWVSPDDIGVKKFFIEWCDAELKCTPWFSMRAHSQSENYSSTSNGSEGIVMRSNVVYHYKPIVVFGCERDLILYKLFHVGNYAS